MTRPLQFIPFKSRADKGWDEAWALYEISFPDCERWNAAGYDRTRWYALDQTVLSIYADTDSHFTEPDSPFPDPVPAIPKRNPKHTPKGKPKDGVLSKQDGKGRYEDGKENDGGHPLRYGRIL